MLNTSSRAGQSLAQPVGRKSSWSSSGDTSYYDARDHLTGDESADNGDANGGSNPAFGGVETPQDLQAAHDRATAYYENGAYLHDNAATTPSNESTLRAFRKKQPTKKSKKFKLPYHLTAETNVDSTTTADEAGVHAAEEETDDDFGFKFRPAIPPPRPLQSPGKQAKGGSLTLEDTLSMKRPPAAATAPAAHVSSGILLETNIDSELDDNSSIPSSYYPDAVVKQPYLPRQQQSQPLSNGLAHGSLVTSRGAGGQQPTVSGPQQPQMPAAARVAAAFHFNTAVREEDETTTAANSEEAEATTVEVPAQAARRATVAGSDSETMTEIAGGEAWSRSLTGLGREEVPRMATWSPRAPNSPSLTVIEASGSLGGGLSNPYKSPAGTSLSQSSYSQAPPVLKQHQQHHQQHSRRQAPPPRMLARLDTDFEVSTDEADFTETTPGDMAILEYSRALEEAERMRHAAAGNYVFAQPPGSQQFTGSVPEYINYAGRDSATIGSVGLRAKSMNTLNSSRASLRGSGKVLLTPGRARRASLRRSRLGLMDSTGGGVYSIRVEDSNPEPQTSGNSYTNFAVASLSSDDLQVPVVQHHGPLRSSTGPAKSGLLGRCCGPCVESCCPNTPRKILIRWLLIAGICVCGVLLASAVAVIVVTTRPKDTSGAA